MYTARDYEALFTEPVGEDLVEQQLRHDKVASYCARTIRAGKMLECEAYPIWNTRGEAGKAREARGKTRPAQQRVNQRNAEKRIIRRMNTNFDETDLFVTVTYKGEVPNEAEARRHMQNYIRRVKAWRKRNGPGCGGEAMEKRGTGTNALATAGRKWAGGPGAVHAQGSIRIPAV